MSRIKLTRGQVTIVDVEDFKKLNLVKWHSNGRYAMRTLHRKNAPMLKVLMHREIMGAKPGEVVDHINGNTLDNRRKNLRIVTHAQNSWNSKRRRKGLKGAFKHEYSGLWRSHIMAHGTLHFLGYFVTELEAHRAYCKAAKKLHGNYARFE